MNIPELDFEKTPLIPAVVRDSVTKAVLMVAYMNRDAVERSATTGETWFWSRSRGELWHKGATSGNRQKIVSISVDCDRDALLVDVVPSGPACHTGATSCFGDASEFQLSALVALLESRRTEKPDGSYTAGLFVKGTNAILKKIGEEATEVILAATSESRERLVEEVADLAFHTLLLLVDRGIAPQEIGEALARRSGVRRTPAAL